MKNKKGFTLLELLVVVLIIGILAGIALPQYRKSVEKAKVAEALMNFKVIDESIQRYILTNGSPNEAVGFKDIMDVELSGGEWVDGSYKTKHFLYSAAIHPDAYGIEIYRIVNDNYLSIYELYKYGDLKNCVTETNEMGRYICKYLEAQGWGYDDGNM